MPRRSATSVLAGVRTAMSRHGATKVTIVGHSLGQKFAFCCCFDCPFPEAGNITGGAIALITSVYLPLHLPTGTVFKTVTYGMPRVRRSIFIFHLSIECALSRLATKHLLTMSMPAVTSRASLTSEYYRTPLLLWSRTNSFPGMTLYLLFPVRHNLLSDA
jgi:hypothetical protein